MNQQQPIHRRRLTRAEIRRRRRNRAIRRIAGLTLVVCVAVGGVSFLLSRRKARCLRQMPPGAPPIV